MGKQIYLSSILCTSGGDYCVGQTLQKYFELERVNFRRGASAGGRMDIFHLREYGVTLTHYQGYSQEKGWRTYIIDLYGTDEKVGEVEKIVQTALEEAEEDIRKK